MEPPSTLSAYPETLNALESYGFRPDALIEILHAAQKEHGYLDTCLLSGVAALLNLPESLVFGVATFYHSFSLDPPLQHTCTVCTGTSCHLKGGGRIFDDLKKLLAGYPEISVSSVRCVGACGMAPLAFLDNRMISADSAASLAEAAKKLTDRHLTETL